MKTIDEAIARTKWCPMTRVGSDHAVNRSSTGRVPEQAKCITSACMMWDDKSMPGTKDKDAYGYCGLAWKT